MDMAVARPSRQEWRTLEKDLAALLPHLKAFARSLTGEPDKADDLVQDTLMKAWTARDSFEEGTNLKAWTFMIMRNQFYSEKRRSWRESQLDPAVAERTLTTGGMPQAEAQYDWRAVRLYMVHLPEEQRDALVAVGYLVHAYEDVAGMLDVAVGTVKSRVSRARRALAAVMLHGAPPEVDQGTLRTLGSRTRGLSKSCPFYPIAEAYEELYRELLDMPRCIRRRKGEAARAEPASATDQARVRARVSVPASIGEFEETLEELMMYDDGF